MYGKEDYAIYNSTHGFSKAFRPVLFTTLIISLAACGGKSGTPPAQNSAPTASNVSIIDTNGGQAVIGDTLTASYTYADSENDAEGDTAFLWLRNGTAISGATALIYTVVAADAGQSLTLQVTPVASSGETTGSAVTSPVINIPLANTAPVASNVAVSVATTEENGDTPVVGSRLTGAYVYSDSDGDAEATTTFRWLRNGVAISAATASTYTLVMADSGQAIRFEVTPVAAVGEATGSAVTSAAMTVVNLAPVASGASVTDNNGGVVEVGDVLTGNYSYFDIDGDAEGASVFTWFRGDGLFNTAIPGATASTYTVVAADGGQQVGFEVTPIAVSGVAMGRAATSRGVYVVNDAPVASNVSITDVNGGAAVVGDTLNGSYTYSDTENDVEASTTFRWLSNDYPISGATAKSYALLAGDVARRITFEVTPVAATGSLRGTAVESAVLATGTPPVVQGFARYLDVNMNGINDAGDMIRLPFDQAVSVNAGSANDLSLPVSGDSLGTGASIAAGPDSGEITITLGSSPSLKSRQTFASLTTANQPSAIDVSALLGADVIEGGSGIDAQASTPVDILSTYVLGQRLSASGAYDVALGDLDSDGDLDVVIANGFSQPNQIYFNNGDGSYTDSGQALGAFKSKAVALGDIDGDGDLDMIVANDGDMHRVYKNSGNSGNGVMVDSGQTLGIANNHANAIALGDMDSDGDLDFIVTHDFNGATQYFINNGAGAFYLSASNSLGRDGNAVALGDVDADGDTDVLIAFSGDNGLPNAIFLNDGSGGFTDSSEALGSSMSEGVALGDIDGDGDLDAVVANNWPLANKVYTNDGNGAFTDSGQSLGDNRSNNVVLRDIDADGDLDMLVANYDSKPNRIYINDGSGSFSDSGQRIVPSFNDSKAVAVGDVDGDGDMDLIAVTNGQGNPVYLNSLTGTWGDANYSDTAQALGNADSRAVALGDVDGDGDLDKVVANYNQPNKVYLNDGTGAYTDSTQALGNNNSTALALADIDGDGDLDLAVANDGQPNLIYTNNGSGVFSDSGQVLGNSASSSVVLADTDGDQDLDMIVANKGQANRVYINNGGGGFSDSGQTPDYGNTFSIDVGDVNGDGNLDIVIGNNGSANLVYKSAAGFFINSTNSLGTGATRSVKLGDVDGDGDLDLAVANDSEANRIYINDGRGDFTDSGQTLGTGASRYVTLKDIDGDGDLDMLVANANNQANKIYNNNGSGVFTDSGRVFAVNKSHALALGDIDSDGDLDLVVANDTNTPNQVYLSQ